MASNKNCRKSLGFSTPQLRRSATSQSRFSLSNVEDVGDKADNPDKDTNELYQTLMTDPLRKAIFMQFLQSNSKINNTLLDVMKKKADKKPSPMKKKKFESPTAQFRRRALKELESDKLSSDDSLNENLPPSSVPFNQLLKGVVAYVEIICNDQDKSGGAKALLTSMGAIVVDKIRRGVTHVIYKDGSFQTCRKAKYINAYLVSVLWLEAVRRNHCKVSELKYPPFASRAFNPNISDLCEQMQLDYEEVVKDEMERSRNLKRSKSCTLPPRYSADIIEPSQESHVQSILSATARPRESIPAPAMRLVFSSEASSGSDSDIGLVDGEIIHRSPADLTQYSVRNIERETILAINSKLKDLDSSHSANQSNFNLNNSESLGRKSSVRQADRSKPSSISKKKSHADELMKENVNHTSVKKSLTDLQNSESDFSRNGDTESIPMSELQISNSPTKTVTRNGRRKTINSRASEHLRVSDSIKNAKTKESAGISDSSKNDGSESAILSDLEISDTSNKKLPPRSSRRKTVCSSSVNDLSQLKVSDPIKRVSHMNNGKSVDVTSPDILAKETAGVSDSSKIGGTESSGVLDLEISDSSDERLSRNSRRKTINSSINDISQLRISDPVQAAGVSEPISTLRISDVSSKRRQTISSTMSSLRISTASSKNSGDVTKVQDNEFPPKTPGAETIRDPNTNVTLRKKRPINKDLVHAFDKSDNTSESNKNIRRGKRLLYDPNYAPLPITPNIVGKKITESRNNKNTKGEKNTNSDNSLNISNVEIAPVLMTPSASVLLKKRMPDIFIQLDADSDFSEDGEETNSVLPVSSKKPSPPKRAKTAKAKTQPEPTKAIFKEPKTPIARKRAQSQQTAAVDPTTRRSSRVRESISASQSDEEFENPIRSQRNRRSTQEFLPKETFRSQSKLKNTQSKQRRQGSIVCSRFHRHEVQEFDQIVTKLGRFCVEVDVTEKTTHLVIAEPKRTLNLMRAMARGCWVLKSEWLYKSLEEGKWLQEEDYEMVDYSPAVQQSRQQKQAFGVSYCMDIFKACGNIYVAKSSKPRCSDLQELVTLCKGRITTISSNATIVIGEHVDDDDITCVSENWVLDSITFYKKMSPKNYLLKPPL